MKDKSKYNLKSICLLIQKIIEKGHYKDIIIGRELLYKLRFIKRTLNKKLIKTLTKIISKKAYRKS